MENTRSPGVTVAITPKSLHKAFDALASVVYQDQDSQYLLIMSPQDYEFLYKHSHLVLECASRHSPDTFHFMLHQDPESSSFFCMREQVLVEIPFRTTNQAPQGFIQIFLVFKDTSGKPRLPELLKVANLDPISTFTMCDSIYPHTIVNSELHSLMTDGKLKGIWDNAPSKDTVPPYTGIKGLPPRISLKGWNSLPFSEARDLVLSGGFNLNEIDGSTEPCPHVEQVQRKFYTFRGEVTDRFPEMTFSDTCYILFALDAIAPYPNLQSGIQKALAKSPDFFKNARDTLYEKLQGVSASFCGGCEKEYVEDVACTVTDMLKTWYFSLTLKAIPVKESLSIPVANRSDETLLHEFQQDHPELDSIENELERRSKGKPFLVYQDDDCSILDMRSTLSFLKDCRKKEVASQGQYRDPVSNKLLRLFRISEVNWKNRIREICPLDPKSILYRGYCSACDVNFSRYSYPQRQAIAFAIRSIETKGQDYALLFKTKIIPYLQEHPDGEGIYTWLQDNGFRYLHSDLHQATVAGTLPVLTALENPISSDGITKDMHPYFRKGV